MKKIIFEIWRPVRGYEGLYEVSNSGRIRSLNYNHTGKVEVLKGLKNKNGYLYVNLYKDGKQKRVLVHRIVWEAFNGPIPDGYELDHISGDKTFNNIANLRCVTPKENVSNPRTLKKLLSAVNSKEWKHKHYKGTRNALNKPVLQIDKQTGAVIREWECSADACRELGVNASGISECCNGKRNSSYGFIWRFA